MPAKTQAPCQSFSPKHLPIYLPTCERNCDLLPSLPSSLPPRMTCRSWTAAAAPPAYSTCASSTPSICNAHDLCYRCRINWGLGTAWCDAMLLRRCKDVCHANWPNWWDWWHRGFCQVRRERNVIHALTCGKYGVR